MIEKIFFQTVRNWDSKHLWCSRYEIPIRSFLHIFSHVSVKHKELITTNWFYSYWESHSASERNSLIAEKEVKYWRCAVSAKTLEYWHWCHQYWLFSPYWWHWHWCSMHTDGTDNDSTETPIISVECTLKQWHISDADFGVISVGVISMYWASVSVSPVCTESMSSTPMISILELRIPSGIQNLSYLKKWELLRKNWFPSSFKYLKLKQSHTILHN